ncbi:putative acylesterase/phospholipase RssA [Streptomyces achromogenes]|uniref:patatin-like protein n=1 Tax=Streptomyces achromogenes TaxID=67255 RepID=UPI002782237E|nr:patatin-like protein [Streptomyces achromogenes]MDQ0833674.1 putative acylesterase/phospholipase RssA [Streptomyces achromogenes]
MAERDPEQTRNTSTGDECLTERDVELAQETEVRLALVMNGGVSLAVWMGGVTHEIDLLRRASRGDDLSAVCENDKPIFRLWKKIAEQHRKTVRVDVIAGTSAGGLNGLLLATAIGRNTSLPNLRDMWRDSASFKSLLQPSGARSVLNGDQLEKHLQDALTTIKEKPVRGHHDPTVTLFITATALDGGLRNHEDGFGQAFDVRDHRRVYRFKNQQQWDTYEQIAAEGRWGFKPESPRHDFAPSNEAKLLLAGRATASYPVAFDPVFEKELVSHRCRPENTLRDDARCLTDGGVLNNAPFGPVLEEITKRRVHKRPVERVLAFVVPTVGSEDTEGHSNQECSEIPLATVVAQAVKHPQESDLRSGIEELQLRLQTSIRSSRDELFRQLVDGTPAYNESLHNAASSLLEEYRKSRATAVLLDVLNKRPGPNVPTVLITPSHIDTRTIPDILDRARSWLPPRGYDLQAPDMTEWLFGLTPAQRLLQALGEYLHNRLLPPPDLYEGQPPKPVVQGRLVQAAGCISDQLRRAVKITEIALADLERDEVAPGEDACRAAARVEAKFAALNIPTALGEIVRTAVTTFSAAVAPITGSQWKAYDVVSAFLTVEILTETFAPPEKMVGQLTPKFQFLRLGPDSVGPLFTNLDGALGNRKLYGTRFVHFGAFIDAHWRQSDFTWGRLDAVHHLLPILMPRNTPADNELLKRTEERFHRAILAAEDDPNDPQASVDRMRERLEVLRDAKGGRDLLDRDRADVDALKTTCKAALKLVTSGPWRIVAMLVWIRTWAIWRRRQSESLGKAAKRAAAQIGLTGILIFIVVTVLVAALHLVLWFLCLVVILFVTAIIWKIATRFQRRRGPAPASEGRGREGGDPERDTV